MKTITLLALLLFVICPLANSQPSTETDASILGPVTVSVSIVPGGGGLIVMGRDGTPESYPDGTTASLELSGELKGSNATVSTTGRFVKLVGGVAIFRTAEGLPFAYYPSGQVLLCFPKDSVPVLKSTRNTLSDTFFKAWSAAELRDIRELVRDLGRMAEEGSVGAVKTLSVTIHPDSRQELLKFQSVSDSKVSTAAKSALLVWDEMNSAVIGSK